MERINLCETCKNKFRQKVYRYEKKKHTFYGAEPWKSESNRTVDGWMDLKEKEWSEDEPENSDELMLHSEWCIYTRKNDFIPDCSFYQTKHEHETLLAKQPEVVQAVQVNDDYQDMDRTYMTNERALDQRLDCSTKQEGVLQQETLTNQEEK